MSCYYNWNKIFSLFRTQMLLSHVLYLIWFKIFNDLGVWNQMKFSISDTNGKILHINVHNYYWSTEKLLCVRPGWKALQISSFNTIKTAYGRYCNPQPCWKSLRLKEKGNTPYVHDADKNEQTEVHTPVSGCDMQLSSRDRMWYAALILSSIYCSLTKQCSCPEFRQLKFHV